MAKAKKSTTTFEFVDRAACKFIREEANRILSEHFKSFGFSVSGGNAKFDTRMCDMKFNFVLESAVEGGNIFADQFKKYAALHDLNPKWLGKKFKYGNHSYTVKGMKLGGRARKNILITRTDGRELICDPDFLRRQMGR
jgi:hypothetical protein